MPGEQKIDTDTNLDELDTEAALAEISSELFGQGSDEDTTQTGGEDGGEDTSAEGEVASPPLTDNSTTATEGGDQSSVEGAGDGTETPTAPSTWSKAAAEKWAGVDPVIQAEIVKREQDMFRGLEEYKGRAEIGDRYEGVITEFRPILEAEGIDPVEMFGNFAANHYLLARGTPEQKIAVATNLIAHYGIDLDQVSARLSNQPAINPEIEFLRNKVAELEKGVTTITTRETDAQKAHFAQQVEAFSSDPAHPYFNEVAGDIALLLKAGAAKSLEEAYDKAVYANPITRQKEIDRLTAEGITSAKETEQTRADKKAKLKASNVTTIPKSANGTVPVGSMDDTLNATLAAIEARG